MQLRMSLVKKMYFCNWYEDHTYVPYIKYNIT